MRNLHCLFRLVSSNCWFSPCRRPQARLHRHRSRACHRRRQRPGGGLGSIQKMVAVWVLINFTPSGATFVYVWLVRAIRGVGISRDEESWAEEFGDFPLGEIKATPLKQESARVEPPNFSTLTSRIGSGLDGRMLMRSLKVPPRFPDSGVRKLFKPVVIQGVSGNIWSVGCVGYIFDRKEM